MQNPENNYAFIDSQNLNLGIKDLGWSLDFRKFRIYLAEKYGVKLAYLFIGFMPQNQSLYNSLQKSGYILVFKDTITDGNGKIKGNVDADLVLQVMIDLPNYDKAVLVTSDGDFTSLVKYLAQQDKLKRVLSPNSDNCSTLLRKVSEGNIEFMNDLEKKLGYQGHK